MTRHTLVVTGSRSLARDPVALAAARKLLRERIEALPRDANRPALSRVVAGDAPGPDAWALELAAACGLGWVRYALDGWRYGSDAPPSCWSAMPALPVFAAWPLVRNAVMVRECAKGAHDDGDDVNVLGLVDRASRTHGTEHTLGLARRAGLPVEHWTYDARDLHEPRKRLP